MRLVAFMGRGADVRIPPQRGPRSGRVREDWLVWEIDPASARALDLALGLKSSHPSAEVTVVHLGPPEAELWLRQALARGCDRAVRVWDGDEAAAGEAGGGGGAAEAGPAGRALILAAAARVAGFDLIFAGDAGVVGCSGQLGVLVAAELGVPCVTRALAVAAAGTGGGSGRPIEISRSLDGGHVERVEVTLPVVITAPAGQAGPAPGSPLLAAAALLAAREREIPVWGLADLGVPRDQVRRADQALICGPPRPRRPRLRPLPSPDQTLPAFDRILKLAEGAVERREGRVVRQTAEVVADEVFRTLRDEGWLDHLQPTPGPRPPHGSSPGEARSPRPAPAGDGGT